MSVLLCYDGSPSAKHAIEVAHATLGHLPLTVLHVWTPPTAVLADAFSSRDPGGHPSPEALERLALQRAQEILHEGEDLARETGFGVQARLERNRTSAWRTILDVATDVEPDLIVVGTHGATAVQSAPLGSVSNAVVHHSERPVLVVPSPRR